MTRQAIQEHFERLVLALHDMPACIESRIVLQRATAASRVFGSTRGEVDEHIARELVSIEESAREIRRRECQEFAASR